MDKKKKIVIKTVNKQNKDKITAIFNRKEGPHLSVHSTDLLKLSVNFACNALISCEKQINIIDGVDNVKGIGTRLKNASVEINKYIDEADDLICPFTFFYQLSIISIKYIRGKLGEVYELIFEGAAGYFSNLKLNHKITAKDWLLALEDGIKILEMCKYELKMGDNNIYTPLKKFVQGFKEALIESNHDYINSLGAGVQAIEESCINDTRNVTRKYADPGAHSLCILMRASYECIKLKKNH